MAIRLSDIHSAAFQGLHWIAMHSSHNLTPVILGSSSSMTIVLLKQEDGVKQEDGMVFEDGVNLGLSQWIVDRFLEEVSQFHLVELREVVQE